MNAHEQRLLEALHGDPAAWDYDGNVTEREHADGTCACGHAGIRYEFRLGHPEWDDVILGSSCIKTYAGIGGSVTVVGQMQQALKSHESQKKWSAVDSLLRDYGTLRRFVVDKHEALRALPDRSFGHYQTCDRVRKLIRGNEETLREKYKAPHTLRRAILDRTEDLQRAIAILEAHEHTT